MTKLIVTTKEELQKIVKEVIQEAQPEQKQEKKLYTKAEVQSLFKVAMPTIDRWSRQGKLKRITVGSRIYFDAEEVKGLLK
jgi:TRAP-type C4-dicarboxylate transport system substrate-binding protein